MMRPSLARDIAAPLSVFVLLIVVTPLLAIWWYPLGHLGVGWKSLLTVGALAVVFLEIGIPASTVLGGRELSDNVFWMLMFNASVLYAIVCAGSYDGSVSSPTEPANIVQVWQEKLEQITATKEKLEQDKQNLVNRMRAFGIQSLREIGKSLTYRRLADELLELQTQLQFLEGQRVKYQAAIEQIDSARRRLGRRALLGKVGVSQEAFNQLSETAVELGARLKKDSDQSAAGKVELDRLLKETFGNKMTE